jgi:hypothetical protein
MVQVHNAAASRGSFILTDKEGRERRFWPYDGGEALSTLKKALYIVQHNCASMPGCNGYFERLGRGRSLKDMVEDPGIWIHWDPRSDFLGFLATTTTRYPVADISITNYCLMKGRWFTAATLVHEFGHVNHEKEEEGKVSEPEEALRPCGLWGLIRDQNARRDSKGNVVK